MYDLQPHGCPRLHSVVEWLGLINRRVKSPPALFTSIGAEANSGRVSLVRGIAELF
jgi:hypothetical protein